jgi:curved DNA-binding protein CbpA
MSQETPASGDPVDLPRELREQIRDLARALPDLDYYQLLELERDADAAAIRDAFFERSKLYHPDRYFNREVGVYGDLLHEIYKRIVVAHDALRDPKLRSNYDQSLDTPSAPGPGCEAANPPPPRPAGRSLRDRSGLKSRRNPLAGLRDRIENARKKAQSLYHEARELRTTGDYARAADRARLALTYDPRCRDYMDLLGELLPKANAARVTEVRRKARQLLERGNSDAALEALTEAAQLAPTNAGLACQIAELLEKSGALATAIEYANRAVELDEDNIGYLKRLASLYKRDGQAEAARKQLQRAWELDPMDAEVKAELASR